VSSIGFAVKKHVSALKWRDEIRRAQFRPDETRWLFYTLRRYDRSSDVAAASGRRRVWTFQAYNGPCLLTVPFPLAISLFRRNPQVDIHRTQEFVTLAHSSMLHQRRSDARNFIRYLLKARKAVTRLHPVEYREEYFE